MNPKILTRPPRSIIRVLLAGAIAASLAAMSAPALRAAPAAALPSAVLERVPSFHQVGKGAHTYFGVRVYHVALWATGARWNPAEPHALDLESNRTISGDQLTAAGVGEMTRLAVGTPQQIAAWRELMERVLPSVKSGDQLVVFCAPNHKTFFYYNGAERGEIDDPAFGAAFFSIWLDPRTKNPALRKSLLNH